MTLACYHYETISRKVKSKEDDALALDCMSCLISLGIGVEGLINFTGYKIVIGWNERWIYHKKLKEVCNALGVKFVETNEPLLSLKKLKELRDRFVHAKPIRKTGEITAKEDLYEFMCNSWDHALEPDTVKIIYENVQEFKNIIYSNEKVQRGGILTSTTMV
jgi:hypothetical protein